MNLFYQKHRDSRSFQHLLVLCEASHKLFHEVFEEPEFKNKYRLISFAILDDHHAHRSHNPEGNYLPFVKEFGQ